LDHIAEFDARKRYRPAGYGSMVEYCVEALHLSDDAAFRRITAARAAQEFPAIFDAVADGRLHLTAVILLAPHLREGTAAELLEAATHKSKSAIERMLRERFPKSEMLSWMEEPVSKPAEEATELAPERVGIAPQLAPERVKRHARLEPLSSQTHGLHVPIPQKTADKLRRAQELLSHQIPTGDLALVLDRVLEIANRQLEKAKFGSTDRPRRGSARPTRSVRHIPVEVRHAVSERDGGRCTFVSEDGHRCEARHHLEFDHIEPVARGGESTVDNVRILCRAHNQYEAERAFGQEFMRHKREQARTAKREEDPDRDVTPWLRSLGYRGEQLRRGEEFAAAIPNASIEERVRVALSGLVRQRRKAG
jgi:5-methylcytosine-specific restriction endonuclease McrA